MRGENGSTPFVLLIEDDLATRGLVHDLLQEELGVEVVEATDGLKALAILGAGRLVPSLMIVDLMLPNMDGESFMREVRQHYGPELPIIVMSAMDPALVRSSAEDLGAAGVVLKPFDVADLLAEVAEALQIQAPPRAPIIDLEGARKLRSARAAS